MPVKLEYEDVKVIFEQHGCKLISDSYINNTQKLKYIAKCGHNYELSYSSFNKSLSKKCKECSIVERDKIFQNKYSMKSFKKTIRLMETYYKRTLRYRDDYLPENYEKTKKCLKCKKTKTIKARTVDCFIGKNW
jgi:pterin-4a-carbinolamine dehydratase